MGKIIAVINQKGGVGKTTTAAALASGLNIKGYKTLAVDLDAQKSLSLAYRAVAGPSTRELLTGEKTALECIQSTGQGDIIPASIQLTGLDGEIDELGEKILTSNSLKIALEPIRSLYDYIIIDCPPALSLFTLNALIAADSSLIVAGADIFSIQGLAELSKTIGAVQQKRNKQHTVMGIVLTRYNSRTVLSRDLTTEIKKLAEQLGTKVFEATVRESIIIKEAQTVGQSLFQYAPSSNVAKDYDSLINEIVRG